MDILTLTKFFKWCTLINAGLLIAASLMLLLAPDFTYHVQSMWIDISRETFNVVYYSMIGFFKVFFIVFNVVPWIALTIIR